MRPLIGYARRARILLECLAHVAVIGGIALFFIQKSDTERSRRIETAMLFVMLDNEAYGPVRETLGAPWQKINLTEILKGRPDPAALAALKLGVTRNVPDSQVERLADFYLSVLACRDPGPCDATIIDQFYKQNVRGFYCSYDARLDMIAQRLNRPDYAAPIRAYAGSCT